MRLCVLSLVLVFCLPVLGDSEALAGDEAGEASPELKERNWSVTVPLWIPGYRGQFAVGEFDVEGESSGGTGILDRLFDKKLKLNFFFLGALNYEKERWRVHADVFGGDFTNDVVFKLTDGTVASADIKPLMPQFHVAYRLWQHHWDDTSNKRVRLSLFGGFRHQDVELTLNALGQTVSAEASWTDPLIGVWIPIDLSRRWTFEISGDYGGFDVGSKSSWRLYTLAFYRASDLVSVSLGYQIIDVDYRGTVSGNDFFYKARLGGPLAGLKFSF